MTTFPKYERYKDSGVEWLGDVPGHWESERVFSAFNERVETGHPGLPNLNITIGRGVQIEEFEGVRKKRLIEDLNAYKRAAKGDIAYNTMRMWQGAVGDVPVDGLVSPAYVVARPIKPINSRFYSYLFRTETFQTETNRHSYGIVSDRNRLYWLGFKNIVIPIPSREEQDRIVAFLDQKTAGIDALIAKKQRQIELLDEQKAILINRAVTRGIVNEEFGMRNEHLSSSSHSTFTTHHSKFSPSGIEWIGDIPEHWVTAPMYSRCDVRLGKMLDAAKIKGKHLQPYLRNTDVQWFEINSLDLPMMDFRPEEYERYSVKRGDLVVCEGGEPGRAALWDSDEPCFFQKALHRVRPLKGDDPRFLLYLFRNAVTMAAFSGVDKATIAHLTGEQLKRFRFAFPPVTEQAGIAAYLTKAQLRFSETTQRIESHIDSLNTLRSTLIAHAVTGRIKV